MSAEYKTRFFLFVAATSITCLIPCPVAQGRHLQVSETDKAKMIRIILKKKMSSIVARHPHQAIYLLTRNITDALATGLMPSNLLVLTPDQIHEMGQQKPDFNYLRFSKPEARKDRVQIILVEATVKNGFQGTIYECQINSGRWGCISTGGYNTSS